MLETPLYDSLVIIDLESSFDDELRCEMRHGPTSLDCSVKVTHRVLHCMDSLLICQNAAEENKKRILKGLFCSGCMRPTSLCWKIIPV